MKKFLTAEIAPNVRAPFSNRSIDHIQEAYKEIVDGVVKGLINDPTKLTVISGCVLTSNAPNYAITEGYAYYLGEVYKVDAATVNVPSGQTLIWDIEETFRTGDPVLFTDNNPRNVHVIRKLKIKAGASGSGVSNNDNVDHLSKPKWISFPFAAGASGTLQYCKDPFGNVRFRGMVNDLPEGLVTAGTLPEGHRPANTISAAIFMFSNNVLELGRAIFFNNGLVTLRLLDGTGPNSDSISATFDSITFNAN